MIIYVRCDANQKNGFGHFSRCLNIARAIKEHYKYTIKFIGDFFPPAIALLKKFCIPFIDFRNHIHDNSNNIKQHLRDGDYLILDSYQITQKYINCLCHAKIKFIVIDDFHQIDLSKCDLVINFCIGAIRQNYNARDQALGIKYFPVKPELIKIREYNLSRPPPKEVNNILITIGGHDIHNIAPKIIVLLDEVVHDKTITCISAAGFIWEDVVKNNRLNWIPFTDQIEEVYRCSDITLTGGGLSKYESAYCCIQNCNVAQTMGEYADSLDFEKNNLSLTVATAYAFNPEMFKRNLNTFFYETDRKLLYDNCQKIFSSDSLYALAEKIIQ